MTYGGDIFAEIKAKYPDVWKRIYSSYYHDSFSVFEEEHLVSSAGFQQGDPLARLLFSLVLQPLVERIRAEAVDERGVGPALDVGTLHQLTVVVDVITGGGPARGLHLSRREGRDPGKSVVWTPSTAWGGGSRGPRMTASSSWARPSGGSRIMERIRKVAALTDRLRDSEDSERAGSGEI